MNFKNIDKIYVLYINDNELIQATHYFKINNIDDENICFFKGCNGRDEFKYISNDKNIEIINNRTNFINKFYRELNKTDQKRNAYIMKIFLKRDNKGEWGCSQSHINILKDALNKDYKKIIVLEYDVFINKNFNELIDKFNSINLDDFKCISLGSTQYHLKTKYYNQYCNQYCNQNLYNFDNYFSTFSLFLNNIGNFFQEFISILETFILPADHCLDVLSLYYKKNGFAILYPYLFICNICQSGTSGMAFDMKKEAKKRNWDLTQYIIITIYTNEYLKNRRILKHDIFGANVKSIKSADEKLTYFIDTIPIFE